MKNVHFQFETLTVTLCYYIMEILSKCEVDGELEYEFPCYNFVEMLNGLWEENDPRYQGGVYGGVRLHSPPGTMHLLHSVFPRIQVPFLI